MKKLWYWILQCNNTNKKMSKLLKENLKSIFKRNQNFAGKNYNKEKLKKNVKKINKG